MKTKEITIINPINHEAQGEPNSPVQKGTITMNEKIKDYETQAPRATIFGKGLENYRPEYNSNVILCGPSGCGKTTTQIVPAILSFSGNYIVSDVKSSLSKLLTPEFEKNGYTVQTLDFCDMMKNSCSWNPLDDIHMTEDGIYDEQEIMKLAAQICPVEGHDPYWDINARTIIQSLIELVLEYEEVPEKRNLATVELASRLLADTLYETEDQKCELRKFFEECYEKDNRSLAYRTFSSYSAITSNDKTWPCFIMSVKKALFNFASKGFNKLFSGGNKLDFDKFCSQKSCLFINISDTSRDADKIIGLFYNNLFRKLFEIADKKPDGRLPRPLSIIIDDFASFKIENLPGIISTVRSRNIAVTLAFQSITQLDSLYNSFDARTILNNSTMVYMSGRDPETCAYVSQCSNKPLNAIIEMPTDKLCVLGYGQSAIFADKEPPALYLELLEKHRAAETANAVQKSPDSGQKPTAQKSAERRTPRVNSSQYRATARVEVVRNTTPDTLRLRIPSSLLTEMTVKGTVKYRFVFVSSFKDDGSPVFSSILIDCDQLRFDDGSKCMIDLGEAGKTYLLRTDERNAGSITASDVISAYDVNRERYISYIKSHD